MSVPGLLGGVRVVELASYIAAPGAAALLADWGADVVKVEPPAGDPWRQFFASVGAEVSDNAVFETDNRGKRSIALDPADAGDLATLRRLVATADVFVTNVRPPSLRRMGLDWASLASTHPRLIHASITGFGAAGADADKPGFDITAFWARTGLCSVMSVKGGDPVGLRTGIGDHMASAALAGGVCAALYARERTGAGRQVETSLLRMGVYAAASEHAVQAQLGRLASTRPRSRPLEPVSNFFRTADDRWLVTVPRQGGGDWPRLARALGLDALLEDARFARARGRREHAEELTAALDAAFARLPFGKAAAALDAAGLIWGPVLTVAEAAADPQLAAAGCWVATDGETALTLPRGPIDFGARATSVRRAPALDEHGAEIRAELGV